MVKTDTWHVNRVCVILSFVQDIPSVQGGDLLMCRNIQTSHQSELIHSLIFL